MTSVADVLLDQAPSFIDTPMATSYVVALVCSKDPDGFSIRGVLRGGPELNDLEVHGILSLIHDAIDGGRPEHEDFSHAA